MRHHASSAKVRYLLARLRPLGRPIFWGPSIALLLVMLFTWDWWVRPDSTSSSENSDREESVSPEEQAIGADIDSLPVLMNDIGIKASADKAKSPTQSALPTPGGAFAFGSATDAPVSGNTGSSETTPDQQGMYGILNNALASNALASNNASSNNALTNKYGQTPGNSQTNGTIEGRLAPVSATAGGGSLPEISTPLPTVSAGSPLQEAMSRLYSTPSTSTPDRANQSTPLPGQASVPIEGTVPLSNPGIDATQPSASSQNSYTTLVEGSQPYSPPTGYRGTIAPPVTSSSVGPNSNLPPLNLADPVGQSTSPRQTSSFGELPNPLNGYASPAPIPSEQPFSVPRRIPGRSIGGGNINTFSNP